MSIRFTLDCVEDLYAKGFFFLGWKPKKVLTSLTIHCSIRLPNYHRFTADYPQRLLAYPLLPLLRQKGETRWKQPQQLCATDLVQASLIGRFLLSGSPI
jgi:hypothetical protein